VSLTIPKKYLPDMDLTVEGDDPIGSKVESLAAGALLNLLEGGMMLQPPVMRKLTEALGRVPEVAEVVGFFSKGVGRKDGKLQITISLDPAYESVAQQAADFQGVTIPECLQNCWDTAWDNGDFYDPRPHADRVLMTSTDKAELVVLLGSDFTTGTDLVKLIKTWIAEHEDTFSEIGGK
jgi:hypothetical protein